MCRKPTEPSGEDGGVGVGVVLMGTHIGGRKRKQRTSSLIKSSVKWGPNSSLLVRSFAVG